MPRKPREKIEGESVIYHVVSRGNNQRKIFRTPRDYKKFLKILEETKEKYPFYLYSYNLIPNHYHLKIETKTVPVSKIMHQINTCYVKYFNRCHRCTGHLFQDRFHLSVVDKESYFWQVSAYIDLNAFRANLAKTPEDYPWSSFKIYLEKDYHGKLIDRDKFLSYGGNNLEQSRLDYIKFVRQGMDEKPGKRPIFIPNDQMC